MLPTTVPQPEPTEYVSPGGSDGNSGLSPAQVWTRPDEPYWFTVGVGAQPGVDELGSRATAGGTTNLRFPELMRHAVAHVGRRAAGRP